jgi:membrane-associated protease RseP (regulator of RpoE activity)
MRTSLAVVVALFLSPGIVSAQGFLEKLENGLRGVLQNQQNPQTPIPLAPRPQDDVFQPGYLGMVADEPHEDERGPRVLTVRPDSPAEAAGIRVGDVILSIDGAAMRKLDDLDRVLSRAEAGQTLRVELERAGNVRSVSPKLIARNQTRRPADGNFDPGIEFRDGPRREILPERPLGRASLGISVGPISDDARRQFNLATRRGALVTALVNGGPAEQAGIPLGGAIVAADGRVIDSSDQLVELIRQSRPGQELELTYYQGDRLFRKNVRLATAPDSVVVPGIGGDPNVAPGVPSDRPLLRKLEQVLEGAGGGNLLPGQPQPQPGAGNVQQEMAQLRRQVDTLQGQIDRLQRLVEELERRLPRN